MAGIHKQHEIHTRRKGRNYAVGIILGSFVILIFAVTMVKLATPQNENARAPNFSVNATGSN